MYLHIKSFDGEKLTIDSGPGPLLIGHYTSASMWRVASSVLANIASKLPGTTVVVVANANDAPRTQDEHRRSWSFLVDNAARDLQRGGWCWSRRRESIVFIPTDRDEIEDAVYRTMDSGIGFIVDAHVGLNTPSDQLADTAEARARLTVDASYFDVDVTINDPSLVEVTLIRAAQIIEWFNQE